MILLDHLVGPSSHHHHSQEVPPDSGGSCLVHCSVPKDSVLDTGTLSLRGAGYLLIVVVAMLVHSSCELVLATHSHSRYAGLAIGRVVVLGLTADLL